MARMRMIKPEFFEDAAMARLTPLTRLVYIGLWVQCCDDYGAFLWSERAILGAIFPLDDDSAIGSRDIREALASLSREARIAQYEIDGQAYGQVLSWERHQQVDRPSKRRYPAYCDPSRDPREPIARPSRDPRLARVESESESESESGGGAPAPAPARESPPPTPPPTRSAGPEENVVACTTSPETCPDTPSVRDLGPTTADLRLDPALDDAVLEVLAAYNAEGRATSPGGVWADRPRRALDGCVRQALHGFRGDHGLSLPGALAACARLIRWGAWSSWRRHKALAGREVDLYLRPEALFGARYGGEGAADELARNWQRCLEWEAKNAAGRGNGSGALPLAEMADLGLVACQPAGWLEELARRGLDAVGLPAVKGAA